MTPPGLPPKRTGASWTRWSEDDWHLVDVADLRLAAEHDGWQWEVDHLGRNMLQAALAHRVSPQFLEVLCADAIAGAHLPAMAQHRDHAGVGVIAYALRHGKHFPASNPPTWREALFQAASPDTQQGPGVFVQLARLAQASVHPWRWLPTTDTGAKYPVPLLGIQSLQAGADNALLDAYAAHRILACPPHGYRMLSSDVHELREWLLPLYQHDLQANALDRWLPAARRLARLVQGVFWMAQGVADQGTQGSFSHQFQVDTFQDLHEDLAQVLPYLENRTDNLFFHILTDRGMRAYWDAFELACATSAAGAATVARRL